MKLLPSTPEALNRWTLGLSVVAPSFLLGAFISDRVLHIWPPLGAYVLGGVLLVATVVAQQAMLRMALLRAEAARLHFEAHLHHELRGLIERGEISVNMVALRFGDEDAPPPPPEEKPH